MHEMVKNNVSNAPPVQFFNTGNLVLVFVNFSGRLKSNYPTTETVSIVFKISM